MRILCNVVPTKTKRRNLAFAFTCFICYIQIHSHNLLKVAIPRYTLPSMLTEKLKKELVDRITASERIDKILLFWFRS